MSTREEELRCVIYDLTQQVQDRDAEIERLRAEIEAMRKQEPVAWRTFDGEGGYDYRTFREYPQYRDEFLKRNGEKYADWVEPLYLAPGAQSAPSVPDGWREFLGDVTQRISEAGDHTHWSFHHEMVRLAHRAHQMLRLPQSAQTAPSVPEGWQPIETAPKDGTHVLLANKTGTRVADGMYGNYKVWSWPYVMVEPAYWRPMPAAPGATGARQ